MEKTPKRRFYVKIEIESLNLVYSNKLNTTHVKISQLVASLQTSRQQVVFARIVPSLGSPEINGNLFFLMNMYIHICIIDACAMIVLSLQLN